MRGVHQRDCRSQLINFDEPEYIHDCGGEFICPRCLRAMGWCFGCAPEDPYLDTLCDDCSVIAEKIRRIEVAAHSMGESLREIEASS